MARMSYNYPWRPTPVLTGKDAEDFIRRMEETERLPLELRRKNRAKVEANAKRFMKMIAELPR